MSEPKVILIRASDLIDKPLPPPVLLENWRRTDYFNLIGNVYGHPAFNDGELVHTSKIVWIAGSRCQTQNTLYVLGKPA